MTSARAPPISDKLRIMEQRARSPDGSVDDRRRDAADGDFAAFLLADDAVDHAGPAVVEGKALPGNLGRDGADPFQLGPDPGQLHDVELGIVVAGDVELAVRTPAA